VHRIVIIPHINFYRVLFTVATRYSLIA